MTEVATQPVEQPLTLEQQGTFFDESIDLKDPEGGRFTSKVLDRLTLVERRKNRRSRAEEYRHQKLLRKVLANGMRCFYFREPSRVSYLRKADSYRGTPPWLSGRALARTVDLLERANLVKTTLGVHGGDSPGHASTYDITAGLFDLAQASGVQDASLTMSLDRNRLVRLRSRPPERALLAYDPTEQTEEWCDALQSWNAFISKQNLRAQFSPEEEKDWVRHWNQRGDRSGMPMYRPELIQTGLYRQFVGNFEQHGRLYGGWWINAPKTVRQRITINDQPVVELDFSGCAIRMLYHRRGLQCPGDPYELPEVSDYLRERGLPPDLYRDTCKRLLNALINTGEKGRPENILKEHALPYPPIMKPVAMRRMMEKKHSAISSSFRSGEGLTLHKEDSDMALKIICSLQKKGIAALPVHDSFIVREENKEVLFETMNKEYKSKFGFSPVIS